MKLVFSLTLLVGAVLYGMGAANLASRSPSGHIGPGAFPQIIGALMVVALLANTLVEVKKRLGPDRSEAGAKSAHVKTLAAVIAVTAMFVPALMVLGAPLGMAVYLLGITAILNPGRWTQNLLVSALCPAFVYLLLGVWLNSPLPPGALGLFG
ncbi:MAG TPA: tripartite tricarboxylate transporter TctB family protein [Thermomicrobiales bacterium]|nr:tripartite tricarboxylate transporter TctB family protein [Thermomicrobiales bacterium]